MKSIGIVNGMKHLPKTVLDYVYLNRPSFPKLIKSNLNNKYYEEYILSEKYFINFLKQEKFIF